MTTPISTSTSSVTTAAVILPKLSDADQKKFDTVKANLQSALDTLKNGAKSSSDLTSQANAARKAAAEQKIALIKQSLKTLSQFQGLDPKAAARMVAQLAKQLAQAVKDYQAAGGSDTSVTSGTNVAIPSAAASTSNAADSSSASTSTTTTSATSQTAPATSQASAASAYAQTQQITVGSNSSDAEDKSFYDQVTQVKNQLRAYTTQLKNALKTKFMPESLDPNQRDTKAADSALDEVDRALTKVGR